MAKPKVFIDGEAGTTGLQILQRLQARDDIELISVDPSRRKEATARAEALNAADAAILCLPDEASVEAVLLTTNPKTVLIDASTAHRIDPAWAYGFPEMTTSQRAKIQASTRISNPGCYPTGFIALVRPLIEAGLIAPNAALSCNAVSGYSGGGKAMIAEFEDPANAHFSPDHFRLYGLGLEHKHPPEMQVHSGLDVRPLFVPSIGRFAQGMLVSVPLHLSSLAKAATVANLREVLAAHFADQTFVRVADAAECEGLKGLEPEALNNTNKLELFVLGSGKYGQCLLVARLDNLGKGASGAAVQNLDLALGL